MNTSSGHLDNHNNTYSQHVAIATTSTTTITTTSNSLLVQKCKLLEFENPQHVLNINNLPVNYITKNRSVIFDWYLDVYEFLYNGNDQVFIDLLKIYKVKFPKEYLNSIIYNALILLDYYISRNSYLNTKYYQLLASSTFLSAFLIENNIQCYLNGNINNKGHNGCINKDDIDGLYQLLLEVFVYLCENTFTKHQLHVTVQLIRKNIDNNNCIRSFITPYHYSVDYNTMFSTSVYLVANNINMLHSYKSYEIFKTCSVVSNSDNQNKANNLKHRDGKVDKFDICDEGLKEKIESLINNYMQ
ncbi:hypothetical protein ABK040_006249 [Willaertia magna]